MFQSSPICWINPGERVVPLLDLHSPSLQIPFPSDLNTDLVVEKGGRVRFMLVLGSLQVCPVLRGATRKTGCAGLTILGILVRKETPGLEKG